MLSGFRVLVSLGSGTVFPCVNYWRWLLLCVLWDLVLQLLINHKRYTDTTAVKGPLLVDGTVSFAIRASFTEVRQKKAFRAQFKEGDGLEVQYLIVDAKPENGL
jgi:hypothetical protein